MSENLPKQTILVVDDAPANIDVLVALLSEAYEVQVAINGERALRIAFSECPPDLILLDIIMPGMDGFDVIKELKKNLRTEKIPVIFVTAAGEVSNEAEGFELGAVDYIRKPYSAPIVKRRVQTHLALCDQNKALEELVGLRTQALQQTRLEIVQRLGRAAEFKDNETGLHVIRMSHYARLIALNAGMTEAEGEMMLHAAPMHDIGKIGIPDHILLKSGRLDDDEWEVMHRHPIFGAEIIGEDEVYGNHHLLGWAKTIALTHHEKWDGSGYPAKLVGDETPLIGRITAVADIFDALTTKRPYKDAWPINKAVEYMNSESGRHFDPRLIKSFHHVLPQLLEIKERYAETSSN